MPNQAVPFLCTQLRPVAALSPALRERAAGWVQDLDDDRFKVRERATKDEVDFWLLLEAKDEPTKLDTVIAKWAIDHEIWVETITSTDAAIEGPHQRAVGRWEESTPLSVSTTRTTSPTS